MLIANLIKIIIGLDQLQPFVQPSYDTNTGSAAIWCVTTWGAIIQGIAIDVTTWDATTYAVTTCGPGYKQTLAVIIFIVAAYIKTSENENVYFISQI
jgi:hypothetical protein